MVLGRVLVGVNGQTIAECELKPGRFIIGRTVDNDLQIDSKYISRHHAQIITTASSCVLEDLNSTNGIHVRSKRVRRRILNDGDVVQIGQHEIMYFDERLARTRFPDEIADSGWTYGTPVAYVKELVAYWNRFARPQKSAKYDPTAFDTWWVDEAKDKTLKRDKT